MLDGVFRPAAKVFAGAPDVLAKVFAASQYAAVLDVSAHAPAGFAHLRTASLHLAPGGGVVILLSRPIQRGHA